MRKQKYLYLLAVLFLFTTSCTIMQKSMNTSPVLVQMNLNMSDMDYVGEITGTATQSYVLGLPLGGRRYYFPVSGYVAGSPVNVLGGNIMRDRGLNNAMWDALQQKPDADFILPLNVEVKRKQEFLGSVRTYTVKAKAFKIKAK